MAVSSSQLKQVTLQLPTELSICHPWNPQRRWKSTSDPSCGATEVSVTETRGHALDQECGNVRRFKLVLWPADGYQPGTAMRAHDGIVAYDSSNVHTVTNFIHYTTDQTRCARQHNDRQSTWINRTDLQCDILAIEKIQKRATKLVISLKKLSYKDRLICNSIYILSNIEG